MTVVLEGYIKVPLEELETIKNNLDEHIQNTLNDISNKQNQITNLNDTCTRINVEIADAMKEKMTVMDNEDLNQNHNLITPLQIHLLDHHFQFYY